MNENATSLDRLHDIVVPPDVSWWPPAPGWYLVLAAAAVATFALTIRGWSRWRANTYRRAALAELAEATTIADISELLRRTALAVRPREELSSLTGEAWPAWLSRHGPDSMPAEAERQLAGGMYCAEDNADSTALRQYATMWIRHHQFTDTSTDR